MNPILLLGVVLIGTVHCQKLVNVYDYRSYAREQLDPNAYAYIESGAMEETTLAESTVAFKRYRLLPRYLRDVSNISTRTTVLGQTIDIPIGICPSANQKWFHSEGEPGTARGAEAKNTIFVLSQKSNTPLEEVARAVPNGLLWMQVLMFQPKSAMLSLVRKIETAGYRAIVVTVDAFSGRRLTWAKMRGDFEMPDDLTKPNYPTSDDVTREDLAMSVAKATWSDIDWLKSVTGLPIIVKGILSPNDAAIAVRHRVDGIVVSTHGGRDLDGGPASIDALADVVRAVKGRCEVYLDSGVRTGRDVYTALALGARAVFIGRAALYGLAANGSAGVADVLDILQNELEAVMALTGVTKIADIDSSYVVKQSYYETMDHQSCSSMGKTGAKQPWYPPRATAFQKFNGCPMGGC